MNLEMLPCQVREPVTEVLKGKGDYLTSRNGDDEADPRGD